MEFVNHNHANGESNLNFKDSSFKSQYFLYQFSIDKEYIIRGLELYMLGYRNNDCVTLYDETDDAKCIGLELSRRYFDILKNNHFGGDLFRVPIWSEEALMTELPEVVEYDGIVHNKKIYYEYDKGWSIVYRAFVDGGAIQSELINVTSSDVDSKDLKDVAYEALIQLNESLGK